MVLRPLREVLWLFLCNQGGTQYRQVGSSNCINNLRGGDWTEILNQMVEQTTKRMMLNLQLELTQ